MACIFCFSRADWRTKTAKRNHFGQKPTDDIGAEVTAFKQLKHLFSVPLEMADMVMDVKALGSRPTNRSWTRILPVIQKVPTTTTNHSKQPQQPTTATNQNNHAQQPTTTNNHNKQPQQATTTTNHHNRPQQPNTTTNHNNRLQPTPVQRAVLPSRLGTHRFHPRRHRS